MANPANRAAAFPVSRGEQRRRLRPILIMHPKKCAPNGKGRKASRRGPAQRGAGGHRGSRWRRRRRGALRISQSRRNRAASRLRRYFARCPAATVSSIILCANSQSAAEPYLSKGSRGKKIVDIRSSISNTLLLASSIFSFSLDSLATLPVNLSKFDLFVSTNWPEYSKSSSLVAAFLSCDLLVVNLTDDLNNS